MLQGLGGEGIKGWVEDIKISCIALLLVLFYPCREMAVNFNDYFDLGS